MAIKNRILESSQEINLPSLVFGPIKYRIGYVRHILMGSGIRRISTIEAVKISPRCKENKYRLEDGQIIIVTKRSGLKRPADVTGVLKEDSEGNLKWVSHVKLEEFQRDVDLRGLKQITGDISKSWPDNFRFHKEEKDAGGNVVLKGLRPPQIGGLHAIGSHWSLSHQPATIVMPTGTGKTETMLATLAAYTQGTILVIVPSQILRSQTANKFLTFGLLRALNNLLPEARNPLVGVIKKRPQSEDDLKIFEDCNVIVSTMSALGEESSSLLTTSISHKVNTLIVDEAHHIGAPGWSGFREHFTNKKVLQFTATPYRRDGKLVDGKVIYEYPLHLAQQDGYFKPISFESVYEIDREEGDKAIASLALKQLRTDLASGKDHLMMCRCSNIERAKDILLIYKAIASDFNPVIIHSEDPDSYSNLEQVKSRQSRIIVCVNMLGEGFDLPQLKIAAVHDTHKSLAILLQFTGRFTRSADKNIGDATVVANIADQDVSSALERLYSEDADWNQLLSEYSSEAAKTHSKLIDFLNTSERLDKSENEDKIEISHHLLRPLFSTLICEANKFEPKKFIEGLPKDVHVHQVWLHKESNTLYFITRLQPYIRWTRSKKIRDKIWHLHVLHYDTARNLLYISSSDKSFNFQQMAKATGAGKMISGDIIFRSLGRINRLIFQNVGVRKHGRRKLRYALYTGSDVAEALSISERAGSVKSNLSGTGWENGRPITIGCSYKGRIWARDPGSIPELIQWCECVGDKLKDNSIDTAQIIANVLIPEEVETLPDKKILSIEWPIELLRQSEERVTLYKGAEELSISMLDIELTQVDKVANSIEFCIKSNPEEIWTNLLLKIGGPEGFKVTNPSGTGIKIRAGNLELPIEEFFSNYPPMVRFIDLSELDGNLLIRPQNTQELVYPDERFEIWDWAGIDMRKESIWKDGIQRQDSIQWRAAQQYKNGGFEIVFDDDAAGEAADLICFKEEGDYIRLALVHCKFTKGTTAGERIKDVVEVCSQAVRSAKWKWKFKDLCRHVLEREKLSKRPTRFIVGRSADINRFVKTSRFKEIKPEIIIVQPGLSQGNRTADQVAVLAAAYSYLKETIGVDLDVICSA